MKSELSGYVQSYLREAEAICTKLAQTEIERIIEGLVQLRADGGRLFILGVGGSAANASHAVNDFRKIANIESYTPTDNVSELTARINDDGWDQSYVRWLMGSRLRRSDAVLVFSVGGGDAERHVSNNLVESLRLAREVGAKIYGIVGRDGGFTAKVADACVIVPTVNHKTVTPHTEAFQAVVWHLMVSHPALAANEMKWESLTRRSEH
jgi:D-sedoheptulose 7-phosphate isomerase